MDDKLTDARRLMNPIQGNGLSIEQACTQAGTNRQAYYRWKETLSDTDREMENSYPGFYSFRNETERNCANCGTDKKPKLFKTRLQMNRFCSLACRPLSKEGA